MRKKTLYAVFLIFLALSGCARQSAADIDVMRETASETDSALANAGKNRVKMSGYQKIYSNVDKVGFGEEAVIDVGHWGVWSVSVKDTFITDNVFNFTPFMNSNIINDIYGHYRKFHDNHMDAEGKVTDGIFFGIERVFLLVKISIKNETDKENMFCVKNFRVYDIKSKDGELDSYEYLGEGFDFSDSSDDYEMNAHKITLKPGEEREVVMGGPVPTKLVKEYTVFYDGKGIRHEDIVEGDNAINDLYMVYSVTDKPFSPGAKVFKLNIENGSITDKQQE